MTQKEYAAFVKKSFEIVDAGREMKWEVIPMGDCVIVQEYEKVHSSWRKYGLPKQYSNEYAKEVFDSEGLYAFD